MAGDFAGYETRRPATSRPAATPPARLRLASRPRRVSNGDAALAVVGEVGEKDGYSVAALGGDFVVRVHHLSGRDVRVSLGE